MEARILIEPQQEILDPQGEAVLKALHDLGYPEVADVRVGKFITLQFDPEIAEPTAERVSEMCQRLLANPNVESFTYEMR